MRLTFSHCTACDHMESEEIDKFLFQGGEYRDMALQYLVLDAERQGYAVTLLGRRRPIPELKFKDRTTKGIAERAAINTPIQGSAADIIKIAMIRIHDQLKEFKSRMILQVHDELLFEIHESEIDEVLGLIRKEMEGA
ncbi:MAG: DNA polymerase [Ignavibacteriales bacterium]